MVGPDFDVEVHPAARKTAIAMDNNLAMDFITETSFLKTSTLGEMIYIVAGGAMISLVNASSQKQNQG